MKIYYGKNKLKAKEITLKDLIYKSMDINNPNISVHPGRFSDDSASWITLQKECDNVNDIGARIDVTLTFDPKTDNTIINEELYISNKLIGYDEENMNKLN